ncbi:MAG: hypothetical protein K0R57_1697 [Paenibacillaceae bacterium]|jgi:hypothetical protein|nr:hypothetical protein [Paenibacillaceae bacterium]
MNATIKRFFALIAIFSCLAVMIPPVAVRAGSLQDQTVFQSGFENAAAGVPGFRPGNLMDPEWAVKYVGGSSSLDYDIGLDTLSPYEGNYSLGISAVNPAVYSGAIYGGATTPMIAVNPQSLGYNLIYQIQASADYAGNVPRIQINYYTNTLYHSKIDLPIPATAAQWSEVRYTLKTSSIPANVTRFNITFASIYKETLDGSGQPVTPAGRLGYDAIRMVEEFEKYDYGNGFENAVTGVAGIRPSQLMDPDWTVKYVGGSSSLDYDIGLDSVDPYEGSYSLAIGAVNPAVYPGVVYGGMNTPFIKVDPSVLGYKFTYQLKTSSDYAGNVPRIQLNYYKNNVYQSKLDIVATAVGGQWAENVFVIKTADMPAGTDKFCITLASIYSEVKDANGQPVVPAGRLNYDAVKIERVNYIKNDNYNIRPDKEFAWYTLGETVNYKPGVQLPAFLTTVTGTVYDQYGEVVLTKEVSASAFSEEGWNWTPSKPAYYEIEFSGMGSDGLPDYFSNDYLYSQYDTNLNKWQRQTFDVRHPLLVAPGATKPMEQRNLRNVAHTGALLENDLKVADLLGFRGARYHNIAWGWGFGTDTPINPAEGVYYWDELDHNYGLIKDYGFYIISNIYGTPQWASKMPSATSTSVVTGYSAYGPSNIEYWEDFIRLLVERYKDDTSIWEVWNEPHLPGPGGSVFWRDTPEAYVELLSSAYGIIKDIQPEATVTIGGIGARRYVPFYKRIMALGASDYFDVLAMHGYDLDPWTYNNIAVKAGYEPKPYMNTEGHLILLRPGSPEVNYTERQLSMRMMKELLKDVKFGSEVSTFLRMFNSAELEQVQWAGQNKVLSWLESAGLFRKVPYMSPRMEAAVIHTYMENMSLSYEYVEEYELAGNQVAVRMNNGGADQLIVWGTGESATAVSPDLLSSFTAQTTVTDWVGMPQDISNGIANLQIRPGTMYYINGLDGSRLDLLEPSEDKVIYNETERAREEAIHNAEVPEVTVANIPPFDAQTLAMAGNAQWIDSDWNWVATAAGNPAQGSLEAKFAVAVDEEGLYLAVDVADETHHTGNVTPANLYQTDSVQFAVDTLGFAGEFDRSEFQFGISGGQPVVYKQNAADIGGDIVVNWTAAGNVLPTSEQAIVRTAGHTLYKVFIPLSELYPYSRTEEEPLRLSVLVNQNNGAGRQGYLEWSSGIGSGKKPELFGKIYLTDEPG